MSDSENDQVLYKKIIKMNYDDIIKKYNKNENNIEACVEFYEGWLKFNKNIKYTSQEELATEVKWGLYEFIRKNNKNLK